MIIGFLTNFSDKHERLNLATQLNQTQYALAPKRLNLAIENIQNFPAKIENTPTLSNLAISIGSLPCLE